MVLHQHEAAQFRSEVAVDSLRQRGQDRPPVGRDPAFALVADRTHRNHEVLHQKGLVALEAGSGRDLGIDHGLFNADPGCDLAPAGPLLMFSGFRWRGTLVHAARFYVWTTLQAFQTGDFFPQFSDGLREGGDFTEKVNQQSLKLWTA